MEAEEPLEKDKNEGSKKLRERPTSARPAKRVKAPNLQDQQQPAAPINRNGIYLNNIYKIYIIVQLLKFSCFFSYHRR